MLDHSITDQDADGLLAEISSFYITLLYLLKETQPLSESLPKKDITLDRSLLHVEIVLVNLVKMWLGEVWIDVTSMAHKADVWEKSTMTTETVSSWLNSSYGMSESLGRWEDVQLYYRKIMFEPTVLSVSELNKSFTDNRDIILAISALGPLNMNIVTPQLML